MLRYKMQDNILSANATPRNVIGHVLAESKNELSQSTIIRDSTFDKSSNIFYQLYIWQFKLGNLYPVCIYFLLPKEVKKTYLKMFRLLKEFISNMAPEKILLNIEKATMIAA
uniref:MULE domain-containing protein n=1 Tax=Strongyloides venezuelensis TaxID=75913 RepID=A0A0K0G5P7_STRVS